MKQSKINILIPMNGLGSRFKEAGYLPPKPLIDILGKPMIFWLLDNLNMVLIDEIIIPYTAVLDQHYFQDRLVERYPGVNFRFLSMDYDTAGAAETVYLALRQLSPDILDRNIILMDCDTFYVDDIVSKYLDSDNKNAIFYFEDTQLDPIYSYIRIKDNLVHDIIEKNKISDFANTGVYCFESGLILKEYCKSLLDRQIKQKGEYYISSVFGLMLAENYKISPIMVDEFYCLGTPRQLIEFCKNYLNKMIKVRKFNEIIVDDEKIIKKGNIEGERYYYQRAQSNININFLFPKLIAHDRNSITIERVSGLNFSHLHTNRCLTIEQFKLLLDSLKILHQQLRETDQRFKIASKQKIIERTAQYDYAKFTEHQDLLKKILDFFDRYTQNKTSIIHGDPVFTNVLIDNTGSIKFIDMRGKVGNEFSIYGDPIYDMAKIYQSLIGYDFVLKGIPVSVDQTLLKIFEQQIEDHYDFSMQDVKYYTASLLFSLIPLHDDEKCQTYFEMSKQLIEDLK